MKVPEATQMVSGPRTLLRFQRKKMTGSTMEVRDFTTVNERYGEELK